MRGIVRMLPRLVLPAAIGLGLAYLGTGFLPQPEPALRPPEELRAHGQGFDADSPVRVVLERNVLQLASPAFTPPGSPLAPPVEPAATAAALTRPPQPQQEEGLALSDPAAPPEVPAATPAKGQPNGQPKGPTKGPAQPKIPAPPR